MKPEVTAIMLTCGRYRCIGESIHSFNQQTYPNRRLIILDTHPKNMVFATPLPSNVLYVKANSKDYRSLSDKTRAALELVETELMCMWEDDDLWLPHHLERLVNSYVEHKERNAFSGVLPLRIGHRECFMSDGGVDHHPLKIGMGANLCWCRYIFEHRLDHWKKAVGDPFDVRYMDLPFNQVHLNYPDEVPGYIYRWNNGQGHMSGLYGAMPHEQLYRMFEDKLSSYDVTKERIVFAWRHNYPAVCRQTLKEKNQPIPSYL